MDPETHHVRHPIKAKKRTCYYRQQRYNQSFIAINYFHNVASLINSYFLDLQNVNITLRILFRPIPTSLPNIYSTLGIDYDERVLPSITNEILKAVVVSTELLTKLTRTRNVYFGVRPNSMPANSSHNVKTFREKSAKLLPNVLASLA